MTIESLSPPPSFLCFNFLLLLPFLTLCLDRDYRSASFDPADRRHSTDAECRHGECANSGGTNHTSPTGGRSTNTVEEEWSIGTWTLLNERQAEGSSNTHTRAHR